MAANFPTTCLSKHWLVSAVKLGSVFATTLIWLRAKNPLTAVLNHLYKLFAFRLKIGEADDRYCDGTLGSARCHMVCSRRVASSGLERRWAPSDTASIWYIARTVLPL